MRIKNLKIIQELLSTKIMGETLFKRLVTRLYQYSPALFQCCLAAGHSSGDYGFFYFFLDFDLKYLIPSSVN